MKLPSRLCVISFPKMREMMTDKAASCSITNIHPMRKTTPAKGELNLLITRINAMQTGNGRIMVLTASERESRSFAKNSELSRVGKDIRSDRSLDWNIRYMVKAAVLNRMKINIIPRFEATN